MSETRRQQILDAAYEIVAADGLEGLHARSVAAAIGLNHAAVHYYYRTRKDLLLALADSLAERFRADAAKFLPVDAKAADRVEASLMQAEAYSRSRSRYIKVWVSLLVGGIGDPDLMANLRAAHSDWVATLTQDLESARAANSLRGKSPFNDPELLAATLFGVALLSQIAADDSIGVRTLDLIAESLMK